MSKEWRILGITLLASMVALAALVTYRLTDKDNVTNVARYLSDKAKETWQSGLVLSGLGNPTNSTQDDIRKQLENRQTQFEFPLKVNGNSADFQKESEKIFESIFSSDLYLKYIVKSMRYSYLGDSYSGTVSVTAEYWETREESAFVTEEVRRILRSILTPGMNDHEKVKAIHDYIVLNLQYDTSLQEHSAYGALVRKRAVCQGYAMLVYDMLLEAGIPVKIVEGRAGQTTKEDHGWNLVQLDGHWFHLDTTWDDPTPDQQGVVDYNYYNLTDPEIEANHQWEKGNYPATDLTYYELLKQKKTKDSTKGAVYDSLIRKLDLQLMDSANWAGNRADLERIFRRSLSQRAGTLTFLYTANSARLESDVNDTLQAIGGPYSLRSWQYSKGPYLRTLEANDEIVSIQFRY